MAMDFSPLKDRVDLIVRVAFAVFIAVGCFMVVWPFATAISIAAVVAIVTWPFFKRIRNWCHGNDLTASFILVGLLTVLIVLPITGLSLVSAQQIPILVGIIRKWIASGFTVPDQILDIPWIGGWLHGQASSILGDKQELASLAQKMFDPVSKILLNGAVMLGDGMLQLVLMLFVVFFFYRDGDYISQKCLAFLTRVSGNLGEEVRDIIVNTTRSVVFGIVGSAAGQGIVALIGFWICGLPEAITLSIAVFVLSAVPIGPPLIWGPAAIWLWYKGNVGYAIFLLLWGPLAISSVDNFLKPLLISKGGTLPLSLIYLGVFGGVIAFGFMGIILGPVVIAVGIAMSKTWLSISSTLGEDNEPTEETEIELRELAMNAINEEVAAAHGKVVKAQEDFQTQVPLNPTSEKQKITRQEKQNSFQKTQKALEKSKKFIADVLNKLKGE